jgi:predicted dehydrogenase
MRLLILGTGAMAATHARAFGAIPGCEIVAGADIDLARAKTFADKHGIPQAFGTLESALAWGQFDAVANVTPDAAHYATTMQCLAAGKPVFCEKPLAHSYPLAEEMVKEATGRGLVNMVNLSYRNVAALQKAQALIAAGTLGQMRHVEASYRQSWLVANNWGDWRTEPTWLWRLSSEHGSRGVLGDVGIHILDFVLHATGLTTRSLQARLKTFHKAEGDKIGAYPLDANDSAVMSVEFDNGALGVIHASRFMTGYSNSLRLQVFGDQGALELEHNLASTQLKLCAGDNVHNQAWCEVMCPAVASNYEKFVAAVTSGRNDAPDFAHAAKLQQVLDACFAPQAQAGMAMG